MPDIIRNISKKYIFDIWFTKSMIILGKVVNSEYAYCEYYIGRCANSWIAVYNALLG